MRQRLRAWYCGCEVVQSESNAGFFGLVEAPEERRGSVLRVHDRLSDESNDEQGKKDKLRGYSSAGRALDLHSRGPRFDPA